MVVELNKLIRDLRSLGYERAAQKLDEDRKDLEKRDDLPQSVKEKPSTKKDKLKALRQQYDLYAASSPQVQEEIDKINQLSGKYLTPKLAFSLLEAGKSTPDDEELCVFYSTNKPSSSSSSIWTEISNLPTEPRRRINKGLGALIRGGYKTAGKFRRATDRDLLKVQDFGKEGIVFFQHVLGRVEATNQS